MSFYPQVTLRQVDPERNTSRESQRIGVKGNAEVMAPQIRKPGLLEGGGLHKATRLTDDRS